MSVSVAEHFDVDALKQANRSSEVVAAAGIALRRTGKGRLSARCPFHEDHEPSFVVYERDDHFFCFGCKARGDVIEFLMRREGIGFVEACRRLADQPIRPNPRPPTERPGVAERRWDRLSLEQQVVMNTAGAIYQHCLWRDSRPLQYARGRGLPDWVIRQCAQGYADGHFLESYLRREPRRAKPEFLARRLVVPELRSGHFIWFIGRRLADDGPDPKYLALPGERPILGYDRAAGRREVFLCEGIVDYLVALAWRLPAFSPCGTAVPDEQLGFLAGARTVYGVLDGDTAGRAAAERLGAQLGDRWCPLSLPEGCDLGDLARRPDGRRLFFALLASARQQRRQRWEKKVDGS
jgi:DNA primase